MTGPRTPSGIIALRTAPRILASGRLTRPEVWEARTADLVWDLERGDEPGTPWYLYHRPSVADGTYTLPVMITSSLTRAATLCFSGTALAELALRKAEQAEREAAEADPPRVPCRCTWCVQGKTQHPPVILR